MSQIFAERLLSKLFFCIRFFGAPYTPNILSTIGIIFVQLISNVYLTFGMIVTLYKNEVPEAFVALLLVNIGSAVVALKVGNVVLNYELLSDMRNTIKKLDRRVTEIDAKQFLENRISSVTKIILAYIGCLILACSSGISTALFAKERNVIFSLWSPLDWKNSTTNYLITISVQATGLCLISFQDGVTDILRMLLIYMVAGQLHIISEQIRKIGYDSRKSLKINYNELTECIRNHQIITSMVGHLQNVVSNIFLFNFGIVMMNTCFAIVSVFISQTPLLDKSFAFVYIFICLSQVLIQCYFGSDLQNRNMESMDAVYACNWVDQNRRFKRTIIVLMMRSQKDAILKAGGIVPIALPTFLSFLKWCYSLVALLNHAYSN